MVQNNTRFKTCLATRKVHFWHSQPRAYQFQYNSNPLSYSLWFLSKRMGNIRWFTCVLVKLQHHLKLQNAWCSLGYWCETGGKYPTGHWKNIKGAWSRPGVGLKSSIKLLSWIEFPTISNNFQQRWEICKNIVKIFLLDLKYSSHFVTEQCRTKLRKTSEK